MSPPTSPGAFAPPGGAVIPLRGERLVPPSVDRLGVRSGFTTRVGGDSGPPWTGLNLGGAGGDDPAVVRANRKRVAATFDVPVDRLLFMAQCHGREVQVVDGPWIGDPPSCDAIVTTRTDLALAALVADCTPVLLSDNEAGVVAAVHAGRPGMTAGVVAVAVDAMRDLGARRLTAVVGPSICGRCYEVPVAMRDAAAAVSPVSATLSWVGTPAIDVAAGVVDQLVDADVAVTWVPGCAREDPDLYSYRRDGVTGRYAGVIRLLPGDGAQ